jgi:glucose-6-phosphate 1-dehydrogenase
MKMNNKFPGFGQETSMTELDLSYSSRYTAYIPEAYESLISEAIKGDKSNFIRNDELEATWKIYTPLLHEIEKGNVALNIVLEQVKGPVILPSWSHDGQEGRRGTWGFREPTLPLQVGCTKVRDGRGYVRAAVKCKDPVFEP